MGKENEMGVTKRETLIDIIDIAGTIQSVAIDAIDGYAKPLQAKETILKYIEDMKERLEEIHP